jgi:hypothetical protein
MTTLRPITYRWRTVAARDLLAGLSRRGRGPAPAHDAGRTFVTFMCAYADDVLSELLPGPYADENGRRYARACLIPTELLDRDHLDLERPA